MTIETLPSVSRAFVVDGTGSGEVRELPLPPVGPDDVLVRMEGVYGCAGGDTIVYGGQHPHSQGRYPMVLGHEGIGLVAAIGERAAARRDLKPGDRVAVEVIVPCVTRSSLCSSQFPVTAGQPDAGKRAARRPDATHRQLTTENSIDACEPCRTGDYQLCERNLQHGVSMPLALEHGLWGMYSDFLMVHPRAITHRMADHVTLENAVATAFLANAVRWTEVKGSVQPGEYVAVFGAGPQGIGSAAVATYRGATPILIGLSSDDARFTIALQIGVVRPENIIACDREDVVERVRSLTGGRGCDLAIECSGADAAVGPWLTVLRKRGRGVLCGYHGGRQVDAPIDQVSTKELAILGAWGQAGGFPLAIEMLENEVFDFTPMITNRYRIDQLNEVIPLLKRPDKITMKAFIQPLPL